MHVVRLTFLHIRPFPTDMNSSGPNLKAKSNDFKLKLKIGELYKYD